MKNRSALIIVPALLASTALVGCAEDVGSDAIATKGMYAKYKAIAAGNGSTQVIAELRVGGDNGTYVELIGDDELVASADDDDKVLTHENQGNRHWYEARFNTDEGGTVFNIAFNRDEEFVSAPDSSVILPPPFGVSITDADAGDAIKRGQEIEIVWDENYDGKMEYDISGLCIDNASGSIEDTGSMIVDVEVSSLDEGEECEVTVHLERVLEGDTDAAFEEGGEFLGIQEREIKFISTPADDEVDGMGGAGN